MSIPTGICWSSPAGCQQGPSASGQLYAIDGHPDLSVGRKRFWRGAFLFNDQTRAGPAASRLFAPWCSATAKIAALTNDEIARQPRTTATSTPSSTACGVRTASTSAWISVINPAAPESPARLRERLEALTSWCRSGWTRWPPARPHREDQPRRDADAPGAAHLRDQRPLGELLHAGTGSPPADRHRGDAGLPREGAAASPQRFALPAAAKMKSAQRELKNSSRTSPGASPSPTSAATRAPGP